MEINTSKFGVIDIEDEKIIFFGNGILGFEDLKRYTLLKIEETLPFYWLQAVDDKDIALPCMNPYDIMSNYEPLVDETVLDNLNLKDDKDLMILTTVVVPSDPSKATSNLAAPIIINTANNKGIQYILQNNEYHIRESVFHIKGDTKDADTFQKAE